MRSGHHGGCTGEGHRCCTEEEEKVDIRCFISPQETQEEREDSMYKLQIIINVINVYVALTFYFYYS